MTRSLLTLWLAALALAGCDTRVADGTSARRYSTNMAILGEGATNARGIFLWTDPHGCEYVIVDWHGSAITPRLDKDGKPVCRGG